MSETPSTETTQNSVAALVFGASGEEGRAVLEGCLEAGFDPVYAFTSHNENTYLTDALGAKLWNGNVENPDDVQQALLQTKAQAIYLVTTTDLSANGTGFSDAAKAEQDVLENFAHSLVHVYEQDKLTRHLIVSVREDVQSMDKKIFNETGKTWIQPLDDGSVVPHYSAKGKGGQYILTHLETKAPELKVTLLRIPFLFSNFLGFFAPLSDETKTQWTFSANMGDQPIDMMGARDLKTIVPKLFLGNKMYHGQTIRLVGQQIAMDEIASFFADLFGKDVVYNPLTVAEMSKLPFAAAPVMAQMCQFLSSPQARGSNADLERCQQLVAPAHMQTFQDWLLVHSDSKAFAETGLDLDASVLSSVAVFGATSKEGVSVVKGLLADTRKTYQVRATSRHVDSPEANALRELDPQRVEVVFADYDDKGSCAKALDGMDAAFLLTSLGHSSNQIMAVEERHVHNIIDACEASHSVKHLVFASMMPTLPNGQPVHHHLYNDEGRIQDDTNIELPLDAKAMAVAYARSKAISCTYITLPYSSEENKDGEATDDIRSLMAHDGVVASVSVQELGRIVADVLDSYQVYAGHELALVTDVSVGDQVSVKRAFVKDCGSIFTELSHADAVKNRQQIAKTLHLVPSSRPFVDWVNQHEDDKSFRETLGLR